METILSWLFPYGGSSLEQASDKDRQTEARHTRIRFKSKNIADGILKEIWKLSQLIDYWNILTKED